MGTRIDAVAATFPQHRWFGTGALHLTDAAAREALVRGHHRPDELDLLVNVGVYKDHSIAEPALASIIQEDIGANPGHPPRPDRHGTFSFDLLDGGCGVISAAHVVDGFVGSGAAQLGMIVAGDAATPPFTASGGALLLSHTDEPGVGFSHFAFRTFAEDADLYQATTRWIPGHGVLHPGHHTLELSIAPAFAERALAHATEVARELLATTGIDIDLLIASPYPPGFADDLGAALGIDPLRIPHPHPALSRAHTAGPLATLDLAYEWGDLAAASTLLFVTVGAGISVACAIYHA